MFRHLAKSRGLTIPLLLSLGFAGAAVVATNEYTAVPSYSPPTHVVSNVPLYRQPDLAAGWRLKPIATLPEQVASLAIMPDSAPAYFGKVFAGTSPRGGVYCIDVINSYTVRTISASLGDDPDFGTCSVNHVAVRDLDHDGTPELLAETCQISPIGRPRTMVWTLGASPIPRGTARPGIDSSWSHGLGFFYTPEMGSDRFFSTYCGYGEIVEFRMLPSSSDGGFKREGLEWRQVGKLSSSGEQAITADIDNDGRLELVLAQGYQEGNAEIRLFELGEGATALRPDFIIDESHRFTNVRFLAIPGTDGTGSELVAWWAHELGGGYCEVIRYRLGPTGVLERFYIGQGIDLWPSDGQMTLADPERSGRLSVWFCSGVGSLYRMDPSRHSSIERIAHIPDGVGPITPSPRAWPSLLIGCGKQVLRLDREGMGPLPAKDWSNSVKSLAQGSPAPSDASVALVRGR